MALQLPPPVERATATVSTTPLTRQCEAEVFPCLRALGMKFYAHGPSRPRKTPPPPWSQSEVIRAINAEDSPYRHEVLL